MLHSFVQHRRLMSLLFIPCGNLWLMGTLPLPSSAPSLIAQASNSRGFSRIFRRPPPPPPPQTGVSRGDGFCLISPFAMPDTALVWSDRPTFTWQSSEGFVTHITIAPTDGSAHPLEYAASEAQRVRGEDDSNPPFYTYQLTLDQPLEPGRTYQWQIHTANRVAPRFARLQIVSGAERDRITQELHQLEQHLTTQNITEEAAAIQRAEYFANESLWTDMWTELLSVSEPSEELDRAIAETLTTLCPAIADTQSP